jgi:hypothetical protein
MAQKRSTNKAAQRTAAAQAKVTNAEESAVAPIEKPKRVRPAKAKPSNLPKATSEDVSAERKKWEQRTGEARRSAGGYNAPQKTGEEIIGQAKSRREAREVTPEVETVKPGERAMSVSPLSDAQRRLILLSKGGLKALSKGTPKAQKERKPKTFENPSDREVGTGNKPKPQTSPEGTTPVTYRLGGSNPSPEQGPVGLGRVRSDVRTDGKR